MPTHSTLNPDVPGPFEVTLARALNMTCERLPVQTATSEHKREFFSLADHQRQELAAALQWEYRRCSASLCDDEEALQVLNEQYSNAQQLVTPIHRLPATILMKIFRMVDIGPPSPIRLMLACRRWSCIVEEMPGLQLFLTLGTWTDPEVVQRAVGRMPRRLLNITIHTDQDFESGGSIGQPYSALTIAAENASHWRSLTVHSLPRGGQLSDWSPHTLIASMDISPMIRLEKVQLTSELEPSPLVDRLLHNIGATAMESLIMMETNSLYSIQFLFQTPSTYTFRSLTHFCAMVQNMDKPIDLLPHFYKLEVLAVTNLLLPSYQDETPLPFVQTLRYLYLKTVSIEWMAGRAFPVLESCTIVAPPRPFLALDTSFTASPGGEWHNSFPQRVDMPVCKQIKFDDQTLESLPMFQAGIVAPLLRVWDMQNPTLTQEYFKEGKKHAGIGALEQIRVRHLRVAIGDYYQGLITIITPRHELKTLSIRFNGSYSAANGLLSALMETTDTPLSTETPDGHVTTTGICSRTVTKVICPNLEALELQFSSIPYQNREEVRRWCVQMMEGRKKAGNPLWRCWITWDDKHNIDSWLMLITSNEGVIEDE